MARCSECKRVISGSRSATLGEAAGHSPGVQLLSRELLESDYSTGIDYENMAITAANNIADWLLE